MFGVRTACGRALQDEVPLAGSITATFATGASAIQGRPGIGMPGSYPGPLSPRGTGEASVSAHRGTAWMPEKLGERWSPPHFSGTWVLHSNWDVVPDTGLYYTNGDSQLLVACFDSARVSL